MNVPPRMHSTPRVADLVVAWARVYTSGSRSTPREATTPSTSASTAFPIPDNDDPPFDEAAQGDGAGKGENGDQHDRFKKRRRVHPDGQNRHDADDDEAQ